MKKTYSILMMLAVIVAAVCFTSCHKDDEEDENGRISNPTNTITLIDASGKIYYSLAAFRIHQNGAKNGYLTSSPYKEIWCSMRTEQTINPTTLSIMLKNNETKISDFPAGYDLGKCDIYWGSVNCSYSSGSIKVINNNGSIFTLQFNNYKAVSSRYNQSVLINGTLLVEKERYY